MKKIRTIFIYCGFIVLAISFVACVIDTVIAATNAYELAYKDDIYGTSGEWFWTCLNVLLIPLPFLLSELSLIRNGCVLLTEGPFGARKIRCCISSVIAVWVIVMIVLVETQVFEYGVNNILLLMLWPSVFLSFLLGGIKQKG